MKLNPDCVRDILLCIETIHSINCHYSFNEDSIHNDFPNYSYDEVMYHARQCYLSGYFYDATYLNHSVLSVRDLSPEGHTFLNNIRSDNIWKHTKNIAFKLGSFSLSALSQIASNVVAELIKVYLASSP